MDLPAISYSIDLSLLIILLGVLFLYFGKLISEQKPRRTSSYEVYITGFYFSYIYILLPIFLIFTTFDIISSGFQFSSLLRQLMPLLLLIFMTDFIRAKWQWWTLNKYRIPKEFLEKTVGEMAEKSWFSKLFEKEEVEEWMKTGVRFWRGPISSRLLLLINIVSLLITVFIIIQTEAFLFFKGFSVMLYILILSFSASLYGTIELRYSNVKLAQKVGDGAIELEGILVGIDKDFVTLLIHDKIVHVTRDNILSIEIEKIWEDEENKS